MRTRRSSSSGRASSSSGCSSSSAPSPRTPGCRTLPKGAPAPAAAFLTVVPKIGAAIALARFVDLFPPDAFAVRPLIAIAAFATMTLGNLAALGQSDVRRLLGWSSVSQSGYVLMAVAVVGLTNLALPAILLFMLGYAAANLAAFAAVTHLRGRTDLSDYAGLATSRPWVAVALAVSLLSLVGIPPLAGFVGKLALFLATIEGGYAWLAVTAAMNTVASLFYYLKVVGRAALHRSPTGGSRSAVDDERRGDVVVARCRPRLRPSCGNDGPGLRRRDASSVTFRPERRRRLTRFLDTPRR